MTPSAKQGLKLEFTTVSGSRSGDVSFINTVNQRKGQHIVFVNLVV